MGRRISLHLKKRMDASAFQFLHFCKQSCLHELSHFIISTPSGSVLNVLFWLGCNTCFPFSLLFPYPLFAPYFFLICPLLRRLKKKIGTFWKSMFIQRILALCRLIKKKTLLGSSNAEIELMLLFLIFLIIGFYAMRLLIAALVGMLLPENYY